MTTLGSTNLNLYLDKDFVINPVVHVINANKISTPFDGILGDDFFQSHNTEINYPNRTVKIYNKIIPFNNKSHIVLPARSETIVQVEVTNQVTEGIVRASPIIDNVLLPRALVSVRNDNTAICTILNLNDKEISIKTPKIELEEIEPIATINSFNNNIKTNENIDNRLKTLRENIRTQHLNSEETNTLLSLCEQFHHIFHLPGDQLTTTKTLKHEIATTSQNPIFTKTYRYPKVHEQEVKKQIDKMLEQNIVKPSTSPWSSPVWVVPKKLDASGERKWRIVIDYRKLNEITIGDAYPLPNIESILDQLGQSKYFSTLDLASGFHQIEMSEADKQKTAFTTPLGHYEYNRMPFGLKNAPATFQRLMNTVLTGLQGIKCFVYLDDIVIYAKSLQDHDNKLAEIFIRLDHHNLKLQPDKCEFLRREVAYLGHIISDKGVQPNPDKIRAILEIKNPKNQKDIKSFLGLVGYYRKFIPNFAKLSKPLTSLLKKESKFNWTQECEQSFQTLKSALTNEPILQYPNFEKPFVLTTDASNIAIGSVLSQGDIGNDLPISYYSRTLNKAEQNYSTTEKELLAIVDSVKHFRPYLFGQKFKIITDHKPLTWLMNCKDPSSRLVRWRLKLLEYDYDIQYKPGKINSNADFLSRPINQIVNTNPTFEDFKLFHQQNLEIKEPPQDKSVINKVRNLVIPLACDALESNLHFDYIKRNFPNTDFKNHQLKEVYALRLPAQTIYILYIKDFTIDSADYQTLFDTFQNLKTLLDYNKTKEFTITDIITQNPRIQEATLNSLLQYIFHDFEYKKLENERMQIQTPEEKELVLIENHDHPLSGHQGFQRTYDNIKNKYYWDNMKQDIRDYIQKCEICQKSKTNFKPNKSPMLITTTSKRFCEQIAMDIVGPLPITSNQNRFILTLQDDLTKFVQAFAMPEHNAEIVALHFLKFCTRFGFPDNILSDQGREFCSSTFKEFNKLLSIKHKLASPYHPQTNGSLERTHLTLKDYFKCYVNEDNDDWDKYLDLAVFSYNTHIHKSTSKTPYELVFGQDPNIPNSISKPKQKPTYSDLAQEINSKLQTLRKVARDNQLKSKTKSKEQYDKTHHNQSDFKENDLVLVYNSLAKNTNKKLTKNYIGPYKIIQLHDNNTASVQISQNKTKTYHFNLLKPYHVSGPLPGTSKEDD